jgi:hypothetical protein
MSPFNRRLWIDSAGSLWARLANMSLSDFCKWEGYPSYCKDEALLWRLLERAGIATIPVRWGDWSAQAEVMRNPGALADAPLEEVAMYFAALRRGEKFSEGATAVEFENGRLLVALRRLIELARALPYDAAHSPWLEQRA